MLSLAPYLFRNVFAEHGGPVERVQAGELPVFNRPSFQASAFLRPQLKADTKHQLVVFGSADGSGSAPNPAAAQQEAIAEALKRWAFLESSRVGNRSKYGFDRDYTPNGMAAFPGFAWQARRRARYEALQQYAIVGWWDRKFNCSVHRAPFPEIGMIRIHHGQSFGEVVILYHRAPSGFMAYGRAAGSTIASAVARATVELARFEYVISRHRARGAIFPVKDSFEQRCLYFSTPEGHAEFLERVNTRVKPNAPKWQTTFDGEISGSWSQWATVWRHAVVMPTYDFLDPRAKFFFW
jgi:hypothetical protein